MHSDTAPPLVVLLAHPDDEFAIFPVLRGARNRAVHVLWLTDGGWGGQDRARRERESASVLAELGGERFALHFLGRELGISDGALHRELGRAVPAVFERLSGVGSGAEVLMPAWEGGHQDHDACHLVGVALADRLAGRGQQFSLYHGCGLVGPMFRVLSPLPQNGSPVALRTQFRERLGYAGLCLRYRSQWKSFVGLLPLYLWQMRRPTAFALQPIDRARTGEKPHSGRLLYERRNGPTWEEFAAATAAFRWPRRLPDEPLPTIR